MSQQKTLKLSRPTIEALANLATVNNSIRISSGDVVCSMSPGMDVIARVTMPDPFPEDVPIYDGLGEFLSLMKLFDDPEIHFKSTHLVVRQGRNSQKFRYASPDLFGNDNRATVRVPTGDPADRELDYDYEFRLTADEMAKIKSAARITGAPDFVVRTVKDTDQLEAVCTDKNSPGTTNEYAVSLSATSDKSDVTVAFSIANMKMTPGDYDVSVRISGAPMISHWQRISDVGPDYRYWVAVSVDDRKG